MPTLADLEGDMLVYAHADGCTYVMVDADGACWRWPAEQDGWHHRRRCDQAEIDPDREYEPWQRRLALRLSGAAR